MANSIQIEKKKKENVFKRFGHAFVNFFAGIGRYFSEGSIGTRLSFFIFGAGNFSRRQFVKGALFLLVQVAIILYMVLCPCVTGPNNVQVPTGYKSLINLKLQGNEAGWDPITHTVKPADSSILMLLFGLVTIAVLCLYVLVWLTNIKSSFAADQAVKEGKKPSNFKQDCKELLDSKFHILMLTPTCLAALIFTVLPTVFMISMAFTTYNDIDMMAVPTTLFHWNGLTNFISIFKGEGSLGREIAARFLPVLGWTFIWAIFATLTCYFGGILLAILINKKGLKGKKIFRTFFILTIAIPQFISLLAVRNLLSASGPINTFLVNSGIADSPIGFLGNNTFGDNPYVAKVMVIVINMWLGIPYTMLMTSGILMNIPSDLYEAAKVDGTSPAKMFFKITLPYVIFVTTPYLISSFIGNITSFNTIFLLTGGGPSVAGAYKAGETDLLVTWLYKLTIENGDYNTGAVIGIFTFIITATITLIVYRNSKAYKEEDTFQ